MIFKLMLKDVYLGVLTILFVLHSKYDLWGSIVSGHHVGGHHKVGAGCPRKAKIQDL